MLDEEEWCIVRYRNEWLHLEPEQRVGRPQYDLLVRKVYQWQAVGSHLQSQWAIVARGFKSNEEALKFVCLYKG